MFNETQSSKSETTQNDLVSPAMKKRKSLINESTEYETRSTKPVGDMNEEMHRNRSVKKATEMQSNSKQSNTSHSWSQKQSWRKLIGDKDSSVFSISNIVSTLTPTQKVDDDLESAEDVQLDENEDEDDLIVNVVSKKNSRRGLPTSQELETISAAVEVWFLLFLHFQIL